MCDSEELLISERTWRNSVQPIEQVRENLKYNFLFTHIFKLIERKIRCLMHIVILRSYHVTLKDTMIMLIEIMYILNTLVMPTNIV